MSKIPADAAMRERALVPGQSFIVRAPAGSGKTDLLTRRFLKLLGEVDEPEEILAITFTRAATAEMRARVLKDLEKAARGESTKDAERDILARAALAHSKARGWRLLEQPHRLNIETIDSLCLRIAHNQPLLSRMGGRLSPTEIADPLYAQAARRTLGLLGSADAELNAALKHLLGLRDNHLPDCEQLIAGMLARRDQWVRAFPLTGNMSEEEWRLLRIRLEQPFLDEVKRVIGEVHRLLVAEPGIADELMELARYAYENGNEKIAALAAMHELPPLDMSEPWRCVCEFVLTGDEWRKPKGFDKRVGFPLDGKEQKARMGFLLERLQQISGLRAALSAIRNLPEPRYDERQWETLRHIFIVLRRAFAELSVLFAERNTVDFAELGLAARAVLESKDASPDVLLAMSGNVRHLLVDEFQDTSRSQHGLLQLLIRAWEDGDGRTCFFVGDPMQSVYFFRQAEVELFDQVTRNGLVSDEYTVEFEELGLSTNFRSHEGLTRRWNEMFSAVFAAGSNNEVAQIAYTDTVSLETALPDEAVHVYPQIIGAADRKVTSGEKELAIEREAERVLAIIDKHKEHIERAISEGNEYRVAVLVRSRQHLAKIVALLRKRGVSFRAVELETLSERQELIDLMSLIRALLHPMDRVAWLSVLRAPWCGLTLEDLHALMGADDPGFRYTTVPELIEQRLQFLSADGAERLRRVAQVMSRALKVRFQGLHAGSFSQWIERAWRSLGGAQCVDAAAYENAQVFFAMLDAVTPDGMDCLTEDFETEMKQLYAQPDPQVSERAGVQLITIHKAKGLGFDVVIVPGLNRQSAQDKPPLISSLERAKAKAGESEMLVAPIGYRGDEKHPTYRWVQRQIRMRTDEELKRLLYVACTRARRSLHLLGTATMTASGLKPGDAKSLLATAWPALEQDFATASTARQGQVIAFPAQDGQETGLEIAAGAEVAHPKLQLRRLPMDANLMPLPEAVAFTASASSKEPAFMRPEGSRDARHKGSVVHALLEQASHGVRPESLATPARVLLRNLAYSGKALEEAVHEVLSAVRNCMTDPDGAWILAPHAGAQSEASWTRWDHGALETVRADRVFVAGREPRAGGEGHLWVIDYKMSAPAGDPEFLARQREMYAPQLARYARALCEARRIELPVRFGLYYPRFGPGIARLDWWSEEET